MTTAAIYARFSTDRQDARSIDDQVRRCTEFAKSRGFTVGPFFSDAAISGSHMDRAGMQLMLAETRRRGGPPFQAVLVDDLSRLSRDLGNTWRVVFEDLAAVGVRVIDCMTGMASDGAGARLTFGAMALVNDTFLQLVKAETHRGLEGRALAGFWTGGRVYGYAIVKEENPPDPEHPRSLLVIDEREAAIVRRVFELSAAGRGLASIAHELNAEGIAAPYDTTTKKKQGRGWGQTSIRAMLLNDRYVGRFVWNRRKFIRAPGQKNRRAVERPRSEWRTAERPELAIVSPELWQQVQARVQRKRSRPFGSKRIPHLLSGIAKCGVCGTGIGTVGQRMKNGVRYVTLGCRSHHSRGASVCPNNLTISERKLNAAVFGELRDRLLTPAALGYFVEAFKRELSRAAKVATPAADLDREIAAAERSIANVTDALARVGYSDALGARLRDEEARLRVLKGKRSEVRAPPARALPVEAIEGYVRQLFETLEADPERARALLSTHFEGSPLVLTPQSESAGPSYKVTGAFNLWTREVLNKSHCGGRI